MSFILDNVSYRYSEKTAYEITALDHVNLQIGDGEFIGVIGHTGSGKSTLIQHLNGLLKATEGTIYFNGQDIYEEDYDLRDLRMQVGMVFQYPEHQLFEETVFKDICFGPKNQGLPEKDVTLRAYEALQNVGLPEKYFDVSPFELSGGQKQRVGIARSIMQDPKLILCDEPIASLDPRASKVIMDHLQKINRERKITCIVNLHQVDVALKYSERIIGVSAGKIVFDGRPDELTDDKIHAIYGSDGSDLITDIQGEKL